MPERRLSITPIVVIPKSETEELRVTLEQTRPGKCRVNLREWFRTAEGMRPGRDGLVIRFELLRPVLDALRVIEANQGSDDGAD